MRKPFVAGNWKMNMLADSSANLAKELAENLPNGNVEVAICPPFVYLTTVKQAINSSQIKLGAQNAYFEPKGAFTGEISCQMLKDVGCEYVILGHSERRHILGEDNVIINKKIISAIETGLKPILCVGELLEERDAGKTEDVIRVQLQEGLANLDAQALENLVIAYEPVWAIGTGRTATPEQAQDVHKFIRNWLSEKFGQDFADNCVIQYGGSVKANNAESLMSQPDVDGALVGGASLKAEDFARIVKFKKDRR